MTLCGVRTASNLNGSPTISPMGAKFQAVTRSTRVRGEKVPEFGKIKSKVSPFGPVAGPYNVSCQSVC